MNQITILRNARMGLFVLALMASNNAVGAERDSACVFSKEESASLHVDPWATGDKTRRFGSTEGSDTTTIQNCKGVADQYLALVIGNREAGLASDSGNVISSAQLGEERCEFSNGLKTIPWLLPQSEREANSRRRLKTLRACVGLEVVSLNNKPLVLGNHSSCVWKTIAPNSFVARGTICTLKIEATTAIAVKPVIDPSCLTPQRFESGELVSADLNTALQAFITSDEKASSTGSMIGMNSRRIVFAPSPKVVAFDPETELRFPKTLNLKIQPSAIDISIQRSKDEATSYVTMQMLVRNVGSQASSYPVPLAAETELSTLTRDATGKVTARIVGTWTTYSSGQTLIPADWSGLFITDRAEVADFAFRQNARYRIRMKYYHPHDVAALLKAEFQNRPQTFVFNPNSFDVARFPMLNGIGKVPAMTGFPRMGSGPGDNQPGAQVSAFEKTILQFFRQLGVDSTYPVRYDKACSGHDDSNCKGIANETFIGESIVDFSTEAVPGQVTEVRAVDLDSYTRMANDQTPSAVHFKEREGIVCK